MVLDGPNELLVAPDVDLRVLLGVLMRDRQRAIRAAIVDDRVVPMVVGLSQHALDASAQILCAIENRSDHAHEW